MRRLLFFLKDDCLYDKAIKEGYPWGGPDTNEVPIKWYEQIKNKELGSCTDWAAAIAIEAIRNHDKATIFKIGFKSDDFSYYHLLPIREKRHKLIIENYLGNKRDSSKQEFNFPFNKLNLINVCTRYAKYFLPIMYNRVVRHAKNIKEVEPILEIADPWIFEKIVNKYEGSKITQFKFLLDTFNKNIYSQKISL